jgi:hypothetical protein
LRTGSIRHQEGVDSEIHVGLANRAGREIIQKVMPESHSPTVLASSESQFFDLMGEKRCHHDKYHYLNGTIFLHNWPS